MGSFITRLATLGVGYVYPAYECFKSVEKEPPESPQLIFWCQYWIIIALITVLERLFDAFVSWLPLYGEARLAFIFYLWYPKTMGTTHIYSSFLKPFVTNHEPYAQKRLNELKIKSLELIAKNWDSSFSYISARLLDLMQFLATQKPEKSKST